MRVLLVDNNPSFARAVRDVLRPHGYAVACTEDSRTAVESLRANRPAVVMVSLDLPSDDGQEALRQIRTLPEGNLVQIVVMSKFLRPTDRGMPTLVDRFGVAHFQKWPFDLFELGSLVRRVIALPPPRFRTTEVAPVTARAASTGVVERFYDEPLERAPPPPAPPEPSPRVWGSISSSASLDRSHNGRSVDESLDRSFAPPPKPVPSRRVAPAPIGPRAFDVPLRALARIWVRRMSGELRVDDQPDVATIKGGAPVDVASRIVARAILEQDCTPVFSLGRSAAGNHTAQFGAELLMAARVEDAPLGERAQSALAPVLHADRLEDLPLEEGLRRLLRSADGSIPLDHHAVALGLDLDHIRTDVMALRRMGLVRFADEEETKLDLSAAPLNMSRTVSIDSEFPSIDASFDDMPTDRPFAHTPFDSEEDDDDDSTDIPMRPPPAPRVVSRRASAAAARNGLGSGDATGGDAQRSDSRRSDSRRSEPSRSDPRRNDPRRSGSGRNGSGRNGSGRDGSADGCAGAPAQVLKRLRREVATLEDADDWTVLGIPRTDDLDRIRQAAERMTTRYHDIQHDGAYSDEIKAMAKTIEQRVEVARAAAGSTTGEARALPEQTRDEQAFDGGLNAMRDQNWTQAVRFFNAAHKLKINEPRYMGYLGWALYNDPGRVSSETRVDDALENLHLAVSFDPRNAELQLFLAQIETDLGEYESALRRLRRLEGKAPAAAAALIRRVEQAIAAQSAQD